MSYESIQDLLRMHGEVPREVYLDLENSNPIPREVLEEMIPYFSEKAYGNPTITHKPGWEAYEVIMDSLKRLSEFINASSPEEINITSGDTESNNLAILGAALANKDRGRKVVISEIEPLSVIYSCGMLEEHGFKVVRVPVDGEGFINLDRLSELIDRETVLVSLMMVNNEIGTIEPIREAVEICRDKNPEAVFHTDASSAFGRVPINVDKVGVDLMTISSRGVMGPRGVSALYVRDGVRVKRIIEGQIGTQSLWPGVENTPLIVGFRKAAELIFRSFDESVRKMRMLRDRLIEGILSSVDHCLLNGPRGDKRAPDNVNISFLYCEGEALTIELSLRGVYVSSGSACTRRILQPSHVLVAIGREFEAAHGSILMKVSKYHELEDINYVLEVLPEAVSRLRSMSPVKPKGG